VPTLAPDWLRQAFRHYPTGVAIVTAWTDDGPVGLTVSSLASVSAEPPVLSFSVATRTRSAGALLTAGSVAVHVLGQQHAELAEAFARSGAPRFTAAQGWSVEAGAPPRLPDAVVRIVGSIRQTVPVAGSELVLLDVTTTVIGPPAAPLLHLDRRYRTLTPAPTPGR